MKRFLFTVLFAASLHAAVGVDGLVGFSPSSPHLWANAKVHDLADVGVEVSAGKTLQYVAGFYFLEVPGSHIQNYAVTPLGGRLNLFPSRKVHPYLLANGGIVASTRPIPIPRRDATGLNFLVEFGGGLELLHRVRVGYKLQHISNGSTTRYNPGLENNVFFVAVRIH